MTLTPKVMNMVTPTRVACIETVLGPSKQVDLLPFRIEGQLVMAMDEGKKRENGK